MGLAMVSETANALDMQYDVKALVNLTDEERHIWTDLRAKNPALYSPYFHPDYARIVDDRLSRRRLRA